MKELPPVINDPPSKHDNAFESCKKILVDYYTEIKANGNSTRAKALRVEKSELWYSLTADEKEVLRNMDDNLRQTHGCK